MKQRNKENKHNDNKKKVQHKAALISGWQRLRWLLQFHAFATYQEEDKLADMIFVKRFTRPQFWEQEFYANNAYVATLAILQQKSVNVSK